MGFDQTDEQSENQGFCPQVSVIVPLYNGEHDLPELLNCLHSQTYPAHCVEYLLVDNGSKDNTEALLKSAAATAQLQGLRFFPLAEHQIQGSYAARNQGIRCATGEILAFTDADCRPRPDWLQNLVQPFQDETIGLVAGEIVALPPQSFLERHADRQEVLSQKHTLAHAFYPYGQTANLAVRYRVLSAVGLFRPYLTTGGDADFCWRVQQESTWKLHFAAEAIVQHHHRSTWGELASQWQRYGRSNRYLHELHGVPLMRETTGREMVYLLTRWLAKELPPNLVRAIAGKATASDVFATPISVFCSRARTAGQRSAVLPATARQIDWLPETGAVKET